MLFNVLCACYEKVTQIEVLPNLCNEKIPKISIICSKISLNQYLNATISHYM